MASELEDREMQISFVRLRELEDDAKKLYKEVKRYGDTVQAMHRLEHRMASELCNSQVARQEQAIKKVNN